MSTPMLNYAPVRDGYQFTPGYGVVETKLDGGQSRKRLDVSGFTHTVQLNWVLNSTVEYTDFMGFFRSTLKQGTNDFLMNMLTDIGVLTLHRARCVGGLPRLTANQGLAYFVSATCEVDANPTFSGIIGFEYLDPNPESILVGAFTPPVLSGFLVGDQIQVVNAIPTPTNPAFNFDGVYTVSGKPFSGTLEVAGAFGINSAWGVIHSPPAPPTIATINCTVTRIPT